jgi:hypothetical protein
MPPFSDVAPSEITSNITATHSTDGEIGPSSPGTVIIEINGTPYKTLLETFHLAYRKLDDYHSSVDNATAGRKPSSTPLMWAGPASATTTLTTATMVERGPATGYTNTSDPKNLMLMMLPSKYQQQH